MVARWLSSGTKPTIPIPRFEPLLSPLWSPSAAPRRSPSCSDCCAIPILRCARPQHSRRVDPEREVRLAAAQSLGLLGDRAAVPLLLAAWDQADPDLRDGIARAISRLDTASLGELIARLIQHDDP